VSEESAQVVIIGGGVMGASTAFHLAEAGITDVLLLERGDLAGGSTTKSAGGVRAQFTDAVNIALGARSLAAFENFAQRPGADIDLRQVGYLFLHTSPAGLAAAESAVALQNSMGVESRMLTADEAAARSPGVVTDDVLGATFHARDGYCTPEAVVQAMKFSGLIVRREPISDSELAELLQSVLFVDQARAQEFGTTGAVIASRKYSDATLSRVASISTQVLCECPKHVAELISQLASFEEYSQECLNKNADDAHLHAYLHSISGSARSLFENALEKIARHEGIDLHDKL
jgi:hypothetical protein